MIMFFLNKTLLIQISDNQHEARNSGLLIIKKNDTTINNVS